MRVARSSPGSAATPRSTTNGGVRWATHWLGLPLRARPPASHTGDDDRHRVSRRMQQQSGSRSRGIRRTACLRVGPSTSPCRPPTAEEALLRRRPTTRGAATSSGGAAFRRSWMVRQQTVRASCSWTSGLARLHRGWRRGTSFTVRALCTTSLLRRGGGEVGPTPSAAASKCGPAGRETGSFDVGSTGSLTSEVVALQHRRCQLSPQAVVALAVVAAGLFLECELGFVALSSAPAISSQTNDS